jgi:hypothetical protein
VHDLLGTGSFGQVVRCSVIKKNNEGGEGDEQEDDEDGEGDKEEQVAMKIVKNLPAYHNQGLVEVNILETVSLVFLFFLFITFVLICTCSSFFFFLFLLFFNLLASLTYFLPS